MDFILSDDQKLVQDASRAFAVQKLAPISRDIDKTGVFPKQMFKELNSMDLLGLPFDSQFGGMQKSRLDAAVCLTELGAVSASFALCVAVSWTAGIIIQMFGSDDQKKKYLPKLVKGELVAAIAATEPSSGANWAMALNTRGEKKESHYVVNGSKCFISNAGIADIYLTLVRTNPERGIAGISILIIESAMPGFSYGRKEDKLGLRGDPTGELVFKTCEVPCSQLLGSEGAALSMWGAIGSIDCVFQAAVAHGLARRALEDTTKYVKQRMIGGLNKPLSNIETIQGAIADMVVSVENMKLIGYRGAMAQGPDPFPILCAKYCCETAIAVIDRAMTLHGGYGCTTDFSIELLYRDAKTLSMSKPFDFARNTIGKLILGVPMA